MPDVKNIYHGESSERLCSIDITSDTVKSKLGKLKMNKAPGVDLVGTRMLIELTEEIADMVATLFSKSLSSGDVPQDWRLANVSAVFKKGKKQMLQITDQSV